MEGVPEIIYALQTVFYQLSKQKRQFLCKTFPVVNIENGEI